MARQAALGKLGIQENFGFKDHDGITAMLIIAPLSK